MKTLAFIAFATLFLMGCGTERSSTYGFGQEYPRMDDGNGTRDSKIILSSIVHLTVKHLDSTNRQFSQLAEKYNGYLKENGTAKTVLRIPSTTVDSVMMGIEQIGEVTHLSTQGKDVSDQYNDHSIRLENAEKARSRYLELLAQAETVEAALLVEKELERLNETIELMKGKMNRINHLVDYSTIMVYIQEKKKPGPIGYIAVGVYKGVKWLFVRN